MRLQGLKDVARIAELRGRVTTLEAWRRSAESQRTALQAAVATAVITAFGAVVVLLFNHHG